MREALKTNITKYGPKTNAAMTVENIQGKGLQLVVIYAGRKHYLPLSSVPMNADTHANYPNHQKINVNSSGDVGIGVVANALYKLYAKDAYNGYMVRLYNENNSTQSGCLMLQGCNDNATGTNYIVGIYDGNGGLQGSITFTGGTVTYGTFTANHDVELPTSDNENGYNYGTLVEQTEIFYKQKNGINTERGILYKARKSSSSYSKSVLGAYAGKYDDKDNLHQVYVLGDGHVLCNGENGNISVGDGICASATDGIGMKADRLSMIAGISQEDTIFSGVETKLVPVQYGTQQFTPWV